MGGGTSKKRSNENSLDAFVAQLPKAVATPINQSLLENPPIEEYRGPIEEYRGITTIPEYVDMAPIQVNQFSYLDRSTQPDNAFGLNSKILKKMNLREEKILFYIEKLQYTIQTENYDEHDIVFAKYLADVFDEESEEAKDSMSSNNTKAPAGVPLDSYKSHQEVNQKLKRLEKIEKEVNFINKNCKDMRAFIDLVHRYNHTIKYTEGITVFNPKQPICQCYQCEKRIAPRGFCICQECLGQTIKTDQFESFIFDRKHIRATCFKSKAFLNTTEPYICREKCSFGFEVCDDCQTEMFEALTYNTVPFQYSLNTAFCKSCKTFSPPYGFENCLRCQQESLGLIRKHGVNRECGISRRKPNLYFCKGVNNGCNPKKLLWGSNPYVEGSSICLAALHAEVIDLDGGEFKVELYNEPVSEYRGCIRNDIVSLDYSGDQESFMVYEAIDLIGFDGTKFKSDQLVDHAKDTTLIQPKLSFK